MYIPSLPTTHTHTHSLHLLKKSTCGFMSVVPQSTYQNPNLESQFTIPFFPFFLLFSCFLLDWVFLWSCNIFTISLSTILLAFIFSAVAVYSIYINTVDPWSTGTLGHQPSVWLKIRMYLYSQPSLQAITRPWIQPSSDCVLL